MGRWLPLLLLPLALANPRLPLGRDSKLLDIPDVPVVSGAPGFIRASQLLNVAINQSADPCENFFEFACGGWVAANEIPADLTAYSHFTELREKVQAEMKDLYESNTRYPSKAINTLKKFYTACMDEETIEQRGPPDLIDAIRSLGYWPMVHGSLWDREEFDLTTLLINVGQTRGIDVFVDIYASTDTKNVSRRLLSFDQGGLGLGSGSRSYFTDPKKYAKQVTAYLRYMKAKVKLITQDAGLIPNEEQISRDVEEMFEFETRFANITVAEEDRRNYTELYYLSRLSEMAKFMPIIDWERYFVSVMPFSTHAYLKADPQVIITEVDFLHRLTELLKDTDPRVITNYVIYRYTSAWSMQLGKKYEDIYQDFVRDLVGKKTKSPRWKDCSSSTTNRMPYAAGSLYVRHFFNKAAKATTVDMIDDLQEAFAAMLLQNDWMDPSTKKIAQEKASAMLRLIGFPDFILRDEELDHWYRDLTVSETDTYSQMIEKATRWGINFAYNRLLEPVKRDEFSTNAAVVNAFYSSIKNAIMFPAGILQPPFFDAEFPKSLNYGGIGAVIGHEITHGFDDQGSQFDKDGNLKNWWDASTREKFEERTQCIIDQYGAQEVPNTSGQHLNGKLTQGENIADNGGVKQAYKAYKRFLEKHGPEEALPGLEKYTNDQMFFIGYAQTWCNKMTPEATLRLILTDPHAPGMFRVNVVLQNQPEFAHAFQCPAGSTMNPSKRCVVW
ncbi:unnamed protein product, partial [Mesorhabditis spiculigera]